VVAVRIGFFGTPAFALSTLQALVRSRHETVLVVTQPDRPRGRGQHVAASPVKAFALAQGVPVLQPEKLRDPVFLERIASDRLDLGVVAAYGRILPASLLTLPRLGMINVHASLLPRWRGAAPIHRAILAGDRESGVTIMRVVPALDAGPMLAKTRVAIGPHETSADLEARLATLGADLLVETVNRMAAGGVTEEPQREDEVTYAHRLERSESRVDWHRTAHEIHDQIRGLQPWPVATVMFRGKRMKLLASVPADTAHAGAPGSVVAVDDEGFVVACGTAAVRVLRVQLEGRAPASAREFLNGHRVAAGEVLGTLPLEPGGMPAS
jgi:methionyl-tRNA formyltransferase